MIHGGEIVRGMQVVNFAGGFGRYGRCKRDGLCALTDRYFYFKGVCGGCCCGPEYIEVDLSEVVKVHDAEWWLTNRVAGLKFLIMEFSDGSRVGWMFRRDHDGWMKAFQDRISKTDEKYGTDFGEGDANKV